MSIFQIVMLFFGAAALVASPIRITRAVRRKDFREVFDLLVTTAAMMVLVLNAVWPNAIPAAPRPARWLSIAVLLLWFANWCGLSGWLFRGGKTMETLSEGRN